MFSRNQMMGLLFLTGAASLLFYTLSSDSETINSAPKYDFSLIDPEMAPEPIKESVMRGYNIVLETRKHLPEYTGDRLNCTNCHFSGGNNLGGINGGISLVGVTAKYPIDLGNERQYTLAERINSCFEKSMNGKPLPVDSVHMNDILAYLKWISEGITDVSKAPWLGLKKLSSAHLPNPEAGAVKYETYCAMCHGSDGQGQRRKYDLGYPPLWGPHSFNDAAGMNQLEMLAPFILYNMPYEDARLSVEEALDIASFIIKQPRPVKN